MIHLALVLCLLPRDPVPTTHAVCVEVNTVETGLRQVIVWKRYEDKSVHAVTWRNQNNFEAYHDDGAAKRFQWDEFREIVTPLVWVTETKYDWEAFDRQMSPEKRRFMYQSMKGRR